MRTLVAALLALCAFSLSAAAAAVPACPLPPRAPPTRYTSALVTLPPGTLAFSPPPPCAGVMCGYVIAHEERVANAPPSSCAHIPKNE
jgi:hypothetical protein